MSKGTTIIWRGMPGKVLANLVNADGEMIYCRFKIGGAQRDYWLAIEDVIEVKP